MESALTMSRVSALGFLDYAYLTLNQTLGLNTKKCRALHQREIASEVILFEFDSRKRFDHLPNLKAVIDQWHEDILKRPAIARHNDFDAKPRPCALDVFDIEVL